MCVSVEYLYLYLMVFVFVFVYQIQYFEPYQQEQDTRKDCVSLVAGAWTEREKMYHGGSFLNLADDNMDIQNPEAQNRAMGGF